MVCHGGAVGPLCCPFGGPWGCGGPAGLPGTAGPWAVEGAGLPPP